MTIPYLNIARAVALRANQIGDAADQAALETLFTGSLGSALAGMEVPPSALKLAILASEKRWVERVAKSGISNYMQPFYGRSVDTGTANAVPTQDNAGTPKEFIGPFSAIRDSTDNTPLTEQQLSVVLKRAPSLSTYSFFKKPVYYYHIQGRTIYHTRANGVYFEGCSWLYSAQSTAYDASGNSSLPASLETGWIADVLANLPQENWFVPEAGHYGQIAQAEEASLFRGVVPVAEINDTVSSVEPVKD